MYRNIMPHTRGLIPWVNLFIGFLFCGGLSHAQSRVYPVPVGMPASKSFRVWADNRPVFVYETPIPASYALFEIQGRTEIVIQTNRDIKWVDIRPRSAGVTCSYKDSTIRLVLDKPVQLSIELNGSIRDPLFLVAQAPDTDVPKKNDPDVLYFEAGKVHYPGSIELKSGQTMYVEGGAVVVGVVKAQQANGVRIRGRGVLDGSYNRRFVDSIIRTGNPGSLPEPGNESHYRRFLEFRDCRDVLVEGITLHNGTSWQVVPIHCEGVTIRGVQIFSDQPSDDGIDVVRSRNVQIKGCFIRTKDDCVVIKAHMNYPPSEGVENVEVTGNIFWNALWGNALEIGFELNAPVRDVRFLNNTVIHVEAGAVFSIHNAGRGLVDSILVDGLIIEDARQKLFDIAIFRSQYSEDGTRDPEERKRLYLNGAWDGVLRIPPGQEEYHAQFRGLVRNVRLKNVDVIDGLFPYSLIVGYDERHPVERVEITNLRVHGRKVAARDSRLHVEHTIRFNVY